ncbi:DUF5718 family protein [Sulfurimonas sp. HSL-1716]|uniref:DUF5718 family protein n=1 Tax=Hydrocurvibacter sulfurireducens TaxID=3131937 RepID=UPI0031FA0818
MNKDYKNFLGLGIAGNFALHLKQAGELEDFKDVITVDEAAPKGVFPFYIPGGSTFLGTYPISNDTIKLPSEEVNVQAEPEVALICRLTYKDDRIDTITPTHFGAYNDTSLRKNAPKISLKKNWGAQSKGISSQLIEIDSFSEGGIMDNYRICSFLRRGGNVFRYGEDVELTGYSYFYEKLLEWIKNQINTQENFGPLEPVLEYIKEAAYPQELVISIGATRYTEYGETTFLQSGDEVIVVLYDNRIHCKNPVFSKVVAGSYEHEGMSILAQKVID